MCVCVCVCVDVFFIGTKEVIFWGHGEKSSMFLTRSSYCCVLFAGGEEASAGCVVGVGRWSSCCRRQNKGNNVSSVLHHELGNTSIKRKEHLQEAHVALAEAEAAELLQLIMTVNFCSGDLQKAPFANVYSVHLQNKK